MRLEKFTAGDENPGFGAGYATQLPRGRGSVTPLVRASPARSLCLCLSAVLLAASARAAVVDRVAVVVGNQVLTESEVDDEVRLTEFLNQQPLDLGPEQRRAAAERLVDQQLIRNEIEISHFQAPPANEAEPMLRNFRQEHYASMAQFQEALATYGITEDQLKQHLLWQLAALRFTDVRFQRNVPGPAPPVQSANRLRPGTEPPSENNVDERMDAWLKEARSQTRIEFKKEAFQ